MAEALKINVNEENYRASLTRLYEVSEKLSAELTRLQTQRKKLSDSFISSMLTAGLVEMIEGKEREVQGSIDNINKQIKNIENYLNSLSTGASNIQSKIKAAAESKVEAFL